MMSAVQVYRISLEEDTIILLVLIIATDLQSTDEAGVSIEAVDNGLNNSELVIGRYNNYN